AGREYRQRKARPFLPTEVAIRDEAHGRGEFVEIALRRAVKWLVRMRALAGAPRFALVVDKDRVDQPLRRLDRIDVAEDGVGAAFAHARRDDDVAALAFDREREILQLTLAAADRVLVLPLEQHMRSAGGAAVLARLERLVVGEQRIPFVDAANVLLTGINIDRPDARLRPHRQRDQRARMFGPPLRDYHRVGGRLVESAGAGNAPGALTGRIGIA